MRYSTAFAGLAALAASVVNAQDGWTIQVQVGADGLSYTPNDIKAAVGTKVEFIFNPKNHTVTQSSFADPCHALPGGFFSGFVPTTETPSSTSFTITVADTKPIWFYCSQTVGTHCQKGMVGAINAPAVGNTLAKFVALASNATTSTFPPGGEAGGLLHTGSSSNSNSSSVVTSTVTETTVGYSTYVSAGQTYSTAVTTQTVTETYVVDATATGNAASSTAPAQQTNPNAGTELSAQLFGVAAMGLGALAMM